jgi:hypothetical protein
MLVWLAIIRPLTCTPRAPSVTQDSMPRVASAASASSRLFSCLRRGNSSWKHAALSCISQTAHGARSPAMVAMLVRMSFSWQIDTRYCRAPAHTKLVPNTVLIRAAVPPLGPSVCCARHVPAAHPRRGTAIALIAQPAHVVRGSLKRHFENAPIPCSAKPAALAAPLSQASNAGSAAWPL